MKIELRAYDKENKKMMYADELDALDYFYNSYTGKFGRLENRVLMFQTESELGMVNKPNLVPMMFTGLTIDNQKWFESDIIKHPSGDIGVIQYDEYSAEFIVVFQAIGEVDLFNVRECGWYKIGNIYDNNNLLSKNEEISPSKPN